MPPRRVTRSSTRQSSDQAVSSTSNISPNAASPTSPSTAAPTPTVSKPRRKRKAPSGQAVEEQEPSPGSRNRKRTKAASSSASAFQQRQETQSSSHRKGKGKKSTGTNHTVIDMSEQRSVSTGQSNLGCSRNFTANRNIAQLANRAFPHRHPKPLQHLNVGQVGAKNRQRVWFPRHFVLLFRHRGFILRSY